MRIIAPPTASSVWDKYIPKVAETVPDGFQTIDAIAKDRNLSYQRTESLLKKLMEEGKVERIVARVPGARNPIFHYRPKPSGCTQPNYEKSTRKNKKHRRHR